MLNHPQLLAILLLEQIKDLWAGDGEVELFAGDVAAVKDVLVKDRDRLAAEESQRADEVFSVD